MTQFKSLNPNLIPLIIAITGLLALLALSPLAARAAGPDTEGDLRLSPAGASLPEIAANSSFVAIVFTRGGQIRLRATQGSNGWWPTVSVGTGSSPKLAFKTTVTNNTLHIVWAESNTAIRHKLCTLTATSATCSTPHTIISAVTGLAAPDIAVDSSNRVHVAWVNGNSIQTKLSTTDGASWSSVQNIPVTTPGSPVLAVSASFVHLAFVNNNLSIDYYRSGLASHGWISKTSYNPAQSHDDVRNPAIAAAGNRVYLVWDNHNSIETAKYGLTGALSNADQGATWPTNAAHIPSGTADNLSSDPADRKLAKPPGELSPSTERALRPSLAITGTSFAVVWQERPALDCSAPGPFDPPDNGTSEIYHAASLANSWALREALGSNVSTYAIDPDIAIAANVEHIAFLKANFLTGNCELGGDSNDYAVYYRGPFQTADDGEIFLPIVRKN